MEINQEVFMSERARMLRDRREWRAPIHTYRIRPIREWSNTLVLDHGEVLEPRTCQRFASGSEVHLWMSEADRRLWERERVFWTTESILHRVDGPALILVEGDRIDFKYKPGKWKHELLHGPLMWWFIYGIRYDPSALGCRVLNQAPWFESSVDKMIYIQEAVRLIRFLLPESERV